MKSTTSHYLNLFNRFRTDLVCFLKSKHTVVCANKIVSIQRVKAQMKNVRT